MPDLSFSEVKFHSGHGNQSIERAEGTERPRHAKKKSKGLDENEEFSRFFKSAEAILPAEPSDIPASKISRPSPVRCHERRPVSNANFISSSQPSIPPFELPGAPFLGFGKRAPHTDSTSQVPGAIRTRSSPLKAYGKQKRLPTQDLALWHRASLTPLRRSPRAGKNKATQVSPAMQDTPLLYNDENVDRSMGSETAAEPALDQRLAASTTQALSSPITHGREKIQESKCHNKGTPAQENREACNRADENHLSKLLDEIPEESRPMNETEKKCYKNAPDLDFVRELGKLVQKWCRSDLQLTANLKDILQQDIQEGCATPGNRDENGNVASATQQEATKEPEAGQQLRSSPSASRAAYGSRDKTHGYTPSSPKPLEEIRVGIDMADRQEQNSDLHKEQQAEEHSAPTATRFANLQSFVPFQNVSTRSAAPHLFMSPDSIYQRQMQDPKSRPTTSRVSGTFSPFWLSPAAVQRPVSRSTLRPFPRSFPKSHFARPFSAIHDFSLSNSSIYGNQAVIPDESHYLTPSHSATLPSVKRTESRSHVSSMEQSRFFTRLAEVGTTPRKLWQDQLKTQLESTHMTLANNNDAWQLAEHAMEPADVGEMEGTAFPDNALGPHDDINIGHTIVAADSLQQNDATLDDDLPANFWAPNKLY